jgi:hypothetical protein
MVQDLLHFRWHSLSFLLYFSSKMFLPSWKIKRDLPRSKQVPSPTPQTPLFPEWWQVFFHLRTSGPFFEYLALVFRTKIQGGIIRNKLIPFPSDVEAGEVGYTPV